MKIYGIELPQPDENGKIHVFPHPIYLDGTPGYLWKDLNKKGTHLLISRIEYPVTAAQIRYNVNRENWFFRPIC